MQKDNDPLLFRLLGQCFQDVGLTKWTSVVVKQCPNNADHTKANFDKCIRDYLMAIARFPNIGNQLICWLCTGKKSALMPMHEFTRHGVQLLSYLKSDYLCRMMDVAMAHEKSEQIFFMQPKAHQNKFADLNKTVPTNLLRMIAFFEQCQATNKVAGVLKKISKDKKQPKERKMTHLPATCSHEFSYPHHCCHKYRDYHQSNRCDCDDCQPDHHHQDNRRHNCSQRDDKNARSNKSYDKKDDCKSDYSKKKSTKVMHNDQSSLLSAGNLSGKRSWSRSRSSLRSWSWFCSCSSSRSYDKHHVNQDDCKPTAAPMHKYLYSKDDDDGHYHHLDKNNSVFAPFSTLKAKKKCTQK